MKLNQLRDVLAVADRGSLRAAARHLGLAQPALTRSINLLERELGVTLFERQAKGMRLTTMGEHFARRAHAIHSELKRAREELEQLRGDTSGSISVCMSSAAHIALLPYAMGPFRARYPQIHIDVIEGVFPGVESALRDGTVDCYIGPLRGRPDVEDLVVEKLFDNTRIILARKNHPLAKARSLRDLVGAEWVTTSISLNAEDELALFAQHGLPTPRIVMQAHSALTCIVSVAYSDLLTLLPIQWTEFSVTRDALQKIDLVETLPAPPICIVRRAGLPLTPAAEYFCDMLRRAAGHLLPEKPTRASKR